MKQNTVANLQAFLINVQNLAAALKEVVDEQTLARLCTAAENTLNALEDEVE